MKKIMSILALLSIISTSSYAQQSQSVRELIQSNELKEFNCWYILETKYIPEQKGFSVFGESEKEALKLALLKLEATSGGSDTNVYTPQNDQRSYQYGHLRIESLKCSSKK